MLHLNEFSAWVSVDGKKIPTYQEHCLEDRKTVTGWIASEDGQGFAINWCDGLRTTSTQGRVILDGVPCGCKLIKDADNGTGFSGTAYKAGQCTGEDQFRPFQFSTLRLTDDEDAPVMSISEEVGTILVEIRRIELLSYEEKKPHVSKRHSTIPETLVVHESSKKAGIHRIQLGRAETMKRPKKHYRKRTDHRKMAYKLLDHQPVATFVFKYKPLDILQADEIAPLVSSAPERTPSLTPDSFYRTRTPLFLPSQSQVKREDSMDEPEIIEISEDEDLELEYSGSSPDTAIEVWDDDIQIVKVARSPVIKKERLSILSSGIIDLTV